MRRRGTGGCLAWRRGTGGCLAWRRGTGGCLAGSRLTSGGAESRATEGCLGFDTEKGLAGSGAAKGGAAKGGAAKGRAAPKPSLCAGAGAAIQPRGPNRVARAVDPGVSRSFLVRPLAEVQRGGFSDDDLWPTSRTAVPFERRGARPFELGSCRKCAKNGSCWHKAHAAPQPLNTQGTVS